MTWTGYLCCHIIVRYSIFYSFLSCFWCVQPNKSSAYGGVFSGRRDISISQCWGHSDTRTYPQHRLLHPIYCTGTTTYPPYHLQAHHHQGQFLESLIINHVRLGLFRTQSPHAAWVRLSNDLAHSCVLALHRANVIFCRYGQNSSIFSKRVSLSCVRPVVKLITVIWVS